MHQIITLSPLTIPQETGIKRDERFEPERQFEDFKDKYDFQTLFYQAVFDQAKSEIVLICPKLLNFEAIVKEGEFRSEFGAHPIKSIRKHRRHARVTLRCTSPVEHMTFNHSAFSADVSIIFPTHELSGRNLLITKQKDNNLEWIEAWARHYVNYQKIDAIIIIDNGSSQYSVTDVSRILSEIEGLKSSIVIEAPFPFGPVARTYPRNEALYFQSAMLNLAKELGGKFADAVLCCFDIDELLMSPEGSYAIDEAEEKFLGLPQFQRALAFCQNQFNAESWRSYLFERDITLFQREILCPATRAIGLDGLGYSQYRSRAAQQILYVASVMVLSLSAALNELDCESQSSDS